MRKILLTFPQIRLCNKTWFFWWHDSVSVIGNWFRSAKMSVCNQSGYYGTFFRHCRYQAVLLGDHLSELQSSQTKRNGESYMHCCNCHDCFQWQSPLDLDLGLPFVLSFPCIPQSLSALVRLGAKIWAQILRTNPFKYCEECEISRISKQVFLSAFPGWPFWALLSWLDDERRTTKQCLAQKAVFVPLKTLNHNHRSEHCLITISRCNVLALLLSGLLWLHNAWRSLRSFLHPTLGLELQAPFVLCVYTHSVFWSFSISPSYDFACSLFSFSSSLPLVLRLCLPCSIWAGHWSIIPRFFRDKCACCICVFEQSKLHCEAWQ